MHKIGYTYAPAKAIWRRWGLTKVVTGGQSGVDRATLDVALGLGLLCGGWCPRGRWAEDGRIDPRYPLKETPLARVIQRTLWNIRDSDGSLIIARNRPRGGSAVLPSISGLNRPRLVVDPGNTYTISRVIGFVRSNHIAVLNIGGPRESEDPGIYAATGAFLTALFSPCWGSPIDGKQNQPGANAP